MRIRTLLFSILVMMLVVACTRNIITGRNQLSLVSENQMQDMAQTEYKQFLSQSTVVNPSQNKDAEMVKRVGSRIANAVTAYYKSKNLSQAIEGFNWEYNLVNSKDANAWCMPGGKIVVYSGLLPITQNEAGLAVVVGHEVAHAIARHGSERMSQGLVQQLGGVALSVAISSKPEQTQSLYNNLYGIGSQVGYLLPHSRKQELEADKFGLQFAAMAGYNPREAIPLWERMQANSGGNRPPEFLSTHPAETTRIAILEKEMPNALKFYKPVK